MSGMRLSAVGLLMLQSAFGPSRSQRREYTQHSSGGSRLMISKAERKKRKAKKKQGKRDRS